MSTMILDRPAGWLSYDVTGTGRLVLCSPGFGDLRSTFRELADRLAGAGLRAATTDLRGHGETSVGWPRYTGADVAEDMLAVAAHLSDEPVVLVGNSFSADAAILAAARHPERVAALVVTGPFVRDPQPNLVKRILSWLASRPGIGRVLWRFAWPSFFGPHRPDTFAARRAELMANLAEPGRFDAVRGMMASTHAPADIALPDVTCPVLVVMGEVDPDFPDPAAEARYIAERAGGETTVLMVPEAGHYPHYERVDVVAPAVIDFVRGLG
ncbi:MAG: alpha/beta fold hydrolase [Thermoleophilia bacterium]